MHLRANKIKVLESNGHEYSKHDHKALLHEFYTNLLGSSSSSAWNFDLANLYLNTTPLYLLWSLPLVRCKWNFLSDTQKKTRVLAPLALVLTSILTLGTSRPHPSIISSLPSTCILWRFKGLIIPLWSFSLRKILLELPLTSALSVYKTAMSKSSPKPCPVDCNPSFLPL